MALFMTGAMGTFLGGCWGNWGYGSNSCAAAMPGSSFPGSRYLDTNRQCRSLHQHLGRGKCATVFGDQHPSCTPGNSHVAPAFDCCSSLFFLQAGEPAVHVQGQEPLTASMLAAAPPQEQKQMIGGCHGCSAGEDPAVGLCGHVDLHAPGKT